MHLHADNKVSDQTGRMPRLIWIFVGCTSFCLFCHVAAQIEFSPTDVVMWANTFVMHFMEDWLHLDATVCMWGLYSDTQKLYCYHSKIWTMWLYHRVMSLNDADGMTNSVDPDQTAPLGAVWSGSTLFAQAYLSENLGSLWLNHGTFLCIDLFLFSVEIDQSSLPTKMKDVFCWLDLTWPDLTSWLYILTLWWY